MPIRTTTIGSYPKPDYLRIPDFVAKHPDPTRRYSEFLASRTPEDEALLKRATHETIQHQVSAGIDIPTDGETPRSHYVHHHLRHLAGFDFENLSQKVSRGGAWKAQFPTVTGPVGTGPHFLPDDWRLAQEATDRPVKITMPGPMTIIDSVVDKHYGDDRALAGDLADALNYEVRALAEAGCRYIQIDEPVFARKSELALEWGVEMLVRAFDGIGDDVTRVVHICCGYPSAVDLEDFPKAPREAYFDLAPALDAAPIEAVSIEDAHRHNDLKLLELFQKTTVILGVVRIAATQIESVEEIESRLRSALRHIDEDRLIAAPDCGLAMLDRETIFAKLSNLSAAAHSI
ncbi:MAG: cobalamin-independent methionine synthase II family protein [Alphaproteobacteria bacterium]